MKWLAAVCVALMALASACKEPGPAQEGASFESIDPAGWAYGDVLEFQPTPSFAESDGEVSVAIAVRHTDAYLYSNLWLELATPVAGTDSMRLDTINISLADNFGKWYGRGVGVSFVKSDTLPGRYAYDEEHPARLRHIMRVDTLQGLEQVGLVYFAPLPAAR